MKQVEKGHAGNTVTAYVGGNMEHGLLYILEENCSSSVQREPGIIYSTLSNTAAAVVVAHATCIRIMAHRYRTHHTHAYGTPTHATHA